MASSARAHHHRHPLPRLTERLDQEWERLRAQPSSRARVVAWGQAEPVLTPYDDLDDVLAAARGTGPASPAAGTGGADPDEVLAAVMRRAADDEVAAQLVLRRLLPGLVRIALRRGGTGRWEVKPLFDDLTAAGWLVVRTYPLERRPRRVAANLLLDAEYQVCVRPFRRRSATEMPVPSFAGDSLEEQLMTDAAGRQLSLPRHASEELATLLVECQGRDLPSDDVELLWSLYLDGEPVQAAARRLSVTPRTVLSRRVAATARLRAVA
jgi:hypothetical protein